MCKADSKVTHIKQQKYFHHLKRPGIQSSYYIDGPLGDENIFAVLYVLLSALHIIIKQQFFTLIFAFFLLNLLYTGCYS